MGESNNGEILKRLDALLGIGLKEIKASLRDKVVWLRQMGFDNAEIAKIKNISYKHVTKEASLGLRQDKTKKKGKI